MLSWRAWREILRRARTWDEAPPPDPAVRRLKALLASARPAEDPAADARLWKKLSAQIAALERGAAEAPLSWLLASAGPRFAAAAALALILTAGLAWTQGPLSPAASSAAVQLATLVESPEDALSGALRAGGGDELFQYIAYTSGR